MMSFVGTFVCVHKEESWTHRNKHFKSECSEQSAAGERSPGAVILGCQLAMFIHPRMRCSMQCRAWVGTNWAQEASSGFAVEAPKAANSIKAKEKFGGRDRDRTGDPLLAKQMLSQLSYTPILVTTLF